MLPKNHQPAVAPQPRPNNGTEKCRPDTVWRAARLTLFSMAAAHCSTAAPALRSAAPIQVDQSENSAKTGHSPTPQLASRPVTFLFSVSCQLSFSQFAFLSLMIRYTSH